MRLSSPGLKLPACWKYRFVTAAATLLIPALPAAAQTPTSTTLTASSSGAATATLASGNVLALTAAVAAAGTPVTRGQVNFCDASALACTDIHLLGTAQITPAGTATLRFIPGIGNHSYKAIFLGTPHATPAYAASTSPNTSLAVTGTFPTSTTLTSTGNPGNYSLTATVTAFANGPGAPAVTNPVLFFDPGTNYSLASTAIGPSASSLSWTAKDSPASVDTFTPVTTDINGDGKPDILSIYSFSNQINIFLGQGDGSFVQAPGSPISVTSDPTDNLQHIQVADFNGDGVPDLAITDLYKATYPTYEFLAYKLVILLGHGDGTFSEAPGSPITDCGNCDFGPVVDLNADGVPDILGVYRLAVSPTVAYLGNGDGSFTGRSSNYTVPFGDGLVDAADFNNDGIQDLVQVRYPLGGSGSGPVDVTVLLGRGDGTFTTMSALSVGFFGPLYVQKLDLNHDGNLDLLIVNSYSGEIYTFVGNGDGTFQPRPVTQIPFVLPQLVTLADFNGDGNPDLLIDASQNISLMLGSSIGTFGEPISIVTVDEPTNLIVSADFNGDGLPDFTIDGGDAEWQTTLTHLTQTATATATSISPLGSGIHQITATYPGNSSYAASTSAPIALTAQQRKPTITITPPATAAYTAQPTAITVAISAPTGDPTPTGTVILTSGAYTSAPATLNNGAAILTIPANTFAAGPASLTAAYHGDANYAATTSTASLTVATPSFTLSAGTLSLKAGATTGNTSAITVTPVGGFTGTVALTAALTSSPANGNYPPTFDLSPASVTLSSSNAGTATLTVSTTPFEVCGVPVSSNRKPWLGGSAGTALASLFLLWFPYRRKGSHGPSLPRGPGLLILLFLASASLSACGGSNNGKATCNVASPGTTAGAYTITLIGTSGTAVITTTLNLTVQ